jgi:hypothetical protein
MEEDVIECPIICVRNLRSLFFSFCFLFLLYSVLVSIEKMKIWSERGGGIV